MGVLADRDGLTTEGNEAHNEEKRWKKVTHTGRYARSCPALALTSALVRA
jgi:hypothetical protein